MADRQDIALMSHLMRRAGFGAPRSEIEQLAEQGYENVVEQLLHPEQQPELDLTEFNRYHPNVEMSVQPRHVQIGWFYRMVNTPRPLEEKMALFWHHLFATGVDKVEQSLDMGAQIEMFRSYGMGSFRELLHRVAHDPAMLYWLDNHENHKRAPNENWGRELLELFSLGVGSYTEEDVFEGSRAFTGWTFGQKMPNSPWGQFPWKFEFRPGDHDPTEKSFLGHTGKLNGDDLIDIVVQQPACARFLARQLYNFFVADDVPVPSWPHEPPRDRNAVDQIVETLITSDYEMRPTLRLIFNSDFFKEASYQKVRSPVEAVAHTVRLTGGLATSDPAWADLAYQPNLMGQALINPPTVEGWHTGPEWINSGALTQRVNFVSERLSDLSLSGVRRIVTRISSNGSLSAENIVDGCLDLLGSLEFSDKNRRELIEQVEAKGPIAHRHNGSATEIESRITDVLALVAVTREYQFG
jgi:uncharacterized protein (DUF1800 family)